MKRLTILLIAGNVRSHIISPKPFRVINWWEISYYTECLDGFRKIIIGRKHIIMKHKRLTISNEMSDYRKNKVVVKLNVVKETSEC